MEIYIMRHGETEWNKLRRLQGQTDIDLNENGIKLAGTAAENMKNIKLDIIYSSTLVRAEKTARIIAEGQREAYGEDVRIITDERLVECGFGIAEGNTPEDSERKGQDVESFFSDTEHYKTLPGAESPEEMSKRAESFLREVIEPYADASLNTEHAVYNRVLIVSHGAFLHALRCAILDLPIRKHLWDGKFVGNCNAAAFRLEDGKYSVISEEIKFSGK